MGFLIVFCLGFRLSAVELPGVGCVSSRFFFSRVWGFPRTSRLNFWSVGCEVWGVLRRWILGTAVI